MGRRVGSHPLRSVVGAAYFAPLYSQLYNNQNMTIITRIDYNWGETVPSPTNPDYANWPTSCVGVVNTLKNHSHIWVIGNEPNLYDEGNNWTDNKITPAGYAQIYRDVRNAIHSQADPSPAGEHIVCIAAPSPGGVIGGVRWMDGNAWLGQVIDNIPANEIDGIALHAYGFNVGDFHAGYSSQITMIDGKGLTDIPLYITEWNVAGSNGVASESYEIAAAGLVGPMFADLNTWNQTLGNHNVRCLCWFVYDSKGWDHMSIDYYRTHFATGSNDLYNAYSAAVDNRYAAGITGTYYPGPAIGLTPDSFTHQIYRGDDLTADLFTVTNIGTNTLNYQIVDNAPWLSVAPATGSSTGESDNIAINYTVDTLPIGGPYNAVITVTGTGAHNSPQTVDVVITVVESPFAPPDFNRDGDVDQDDFVAFADCVTGPNNGPPTPECNDADFDDDNDVDQVDFGYLQRCYSGPGRPAQRDCAD